MAIVNSVDKQAVKAALGQLTEIHHRTPRSAAQIVQRAQERMGLQAGDLSSLRSKETYARGVTDVTQWWYHESVGPIVQEIVKSQEEYDAWLDDWLQ